MSPLNDLYKAIRKIDLPDNAKEDDKSYFEGLSYDISYNDILGLPENENKVLNDKSFITMAPFASMADVSKVSTYSAGKMPIQQSFKAVLREGKKLAQDQPILFIDIADLEVDKEANTTFFTEGGSESIAQTIADILNDSSLDNVKKVVRYVRGTNGNVDDKFWTNHQTAFEDIFWPKKNGKATPLITKDADLHIGYYSPSFKPNKTQEDKIKTLITGTQIAMAFHGSIAWSDINANKVYSSVFDNIALSASWNHGKILAVGGKTLMTGGINYWPEYTWAGKHSIVDMQAKVTGDAAISAHKYADYFWQYLNSKHETDLRSFKRSIKLNAIDDVAGSWTTDTPVPIFAAIAPAASKTTGIPVLTTSRIGDWHGSYIGDYPVQIIDALRDFFTNWLAPSLQHKGQFKELVELVNNNSEGKGLLGIFRGFQCSPAAWASRLARVQAVLGAKSSVYISGQMIVGALQNDNKEYRNAIKPLNTSKTKEDAWDGNLWPYDLLLAFATLIIQFRDNHTSDTVGINIVLSNKEGNSDWRDYATVADMTSRIKPLLRGLDPKLTDAGADELMKQWFKVKRVGNKFGAVNSIHTKVVCVDKQLLYIGSDNAYSCYNEEHGIWVDDKQTLDDWVKNYWNVLWKNAADLETTDSMISPPRTD